MNARLRNSLSALAVAAGALSLGLALGEPPRAGQLASGLGTHAVAAIAPTATADERPASGTSRDARRSSRAHLRLPFYPFGQRAGAGVP